MRHERQLELLQRVADAGPTMRGLHGPASAVHSPSEYTDRNRFDDEMRVLFREGVSFFALSCEMAEPGSYRSGTIGGVPILVVRQTDGTLRAVVNACRHRGAALVDGARPGATSAYCSAGITCGPTNSTERCGPAPDPPAHSTTSP